jgi:hypothetical protein
VPSTPIAAAHTASLSASVLQHRVTLPENFKIYRIILSPVLYAVLQKKKNRTNEECYKVEMLNSGLGASMPNFFEMQTESHHIPIRHIFKK